MGRGISSGWLINIGPSPNVGIVEGLEPNVGAKVTLLDIDFLLGSVGRVTEGFRIGVRVIGGVGRVRSSLGWVS